MLVMHTVLETACVGDKFEIWDTLERAAGKNEKLENLKLENLKLEIFHLSSKVPIEVGKFSARTFQIYSFQFHFEFSNLKISNFSFFSLPLPTTHIPRWIMRVFQNPYFHPILMLVMHIEDSLCWWQVWDIVVDGHFDLPTS